MFGCVKYVLTSIGLTHHLVFRMDRCIVLTLSEPCRNVGAADGEAVEFINPRQLVPVQYGMMLPRMGEVRPMAWLRVMLGENRLMSHSHR